MRKNYTVIFIAVILMSCLLSGTFAGVLLANSYARGQYRILSGLAGQMIKKYPEDEQEIIKLIKDNKNNSNPDYLSSYGFQAKDFASQYRNQSILIAVICTLSFFFLLFLFLLILKKICRLRIGDLTRYLEKINLDKDATILPCIEDEFSPLQDEIYKTVTKLRLAKEAAVKERKNFADNLANISHQIKTPVASISIMIQLYEKEKKHDYMDQIKKQTARMEKLVGDLLTLSRIDAGVLKLENKQVDIYTVLQLSVDAVDEIIRRKNIRVSLSNHPEIMFQGDMEWSIEAFLNLIKNCAQHTPDGGFISIDYARNPLYTEITIKDSGEGFPEKEVPHVFERFYQGERALKTGIGIGLSLAKSIIEMQNGFISAENLPEGGACFVIRFYSH